MADVPGSVIVDGVIEHTANHRGALTLYARLVVKVTHMPCAYSALTAAPRGASFSSGHVQ